MGAQELFQKDEVDVLKDRLIEVYMRPTSLDCGSFLKLLEKVNNVLEEEDETIRPPDQGFLPGGVIDLKRNIPVMIVPDLHARMDFFLSIMLSEDTHGCSNLEKLASDQLQVLCVGDGFHAERRAVERWALAYEEYINKYKKHKSIDEEMRESLGVMEMVMEIKSVYPANFHFLKGNHENISNEQGGGNFPFRKFVYEGAMIVEYVDKFYGTKFLNAYYRFEKNLPLFAVGRNFLVSHAEPKNFYRREDITDYRQRPDVVEGLTWTDNDESVKGTVAKMLAYYIGEEDRTGSLYFGGHRVITGLYNLRAGGKYVQIHNPDKFVIALIKPDKEIDPDTDIIEIENCTEKILETG